MAFIIDDKIAKYTNIYMKKIIITIGIIGAIFILLYIFWWSKMTTLTPEARPTPVAPAIMNDTQNNMIMAEDIPNQEPESTPEEDINLLQNQIKEI